MLCNLPGCPCLPWPQCLWTSGSSAFSLHYHTTCHTCVPPHCLLPTFSAFCMQPVTWNTSCLLASSLGLGQAVISPSPPPHRWSSAIWYGRHKRHSCAHYAPGAHAAPRRCSRPAPAFHHSSSRACSLSLSRSLLPAPRAAYIAPGRRLPRNITGAAACRYACTTTRVPLLPLAFPTRLRHHHLAISPLLSPRLLWFFLAIVHILSCRISLLQLSAGGSPLCAAWFCLPHTAARSRVCIPASRSRSAALRSLCRRVLFLLLRYPDGLSLRLSGRQPTCLFSFTMQHACSLLRGYLCDLPVKVVPLCLPPLRFSALPLRYSGRTCLWAAT